MSVSSQPFLSAHKMDAEPPKFLKNVLGRYKNSPPVPTRPHITLTFAQSLDAKIAGAEGRQLILSGKESMIMTHWMRTMHDAILVGIGTAINDDPQLNVRHLPQPTSGSYHLPRPIILDTQLRLPPTCKLLRNFQSGVGRRPWVICSAAATPPVGSGPASESTEGRLQRKHALEAAGARVIETTPLPSNEGKQTVSNTLRTLRDLGVHSIMVEGGASIIASFLAENVVDSLIITIAPVFVGDAGVAYQSPNVVSENGNITRFTAIHAELFGPDTVVAMVSKSQP